MRTLKYAIILLLGGYLILGISHIAVMPPWEGFDENTHYSYIQQLADTMARPKLGSAKISKDIDEYMQYAPMPYCYVPVFKHGEGYTYHSFFNAPSEVVRNGHIKIHLPPDKPRVFRPGRMKNWQAQHPPLYYLVLTPLYKITRGSALIDQIFWLRLCSYLMAWSALAISVYGVIYLWPSHRPYHRLGGEHWMVIGTLCIPLFFPSWYPEMARIGNDSLCALLLSLLWLVFIGVHTYGKSVQKAILIGLLLGLGCLTKVFFVPLSAGVIFYLFMMDTRSSIPSKKIAFTHTLVTIAVLLAVSGWWFVGNLLEGHALLGSLELNNIRASGGLFESLRQNFSLKAWLRGHAAMVVTLGWSCTWSFIRPPYIFMLPLAFLVLFVAFSYLSALPRYKINSLAWSPLWCALPVVAGLSYHVLVRIALTGEGAGTSGYYLLLMVPIIGTAIGFGLGTFWHNRIFKAAVFILGLYAIVFAIVISWAQIMLFAGIIRASDNNQFYRLPQSFPPYFGIPDALANLSTLAYPVLGIIAWVIGGILVLAGLTMGWRYLRTI